jgi:hypothetical protein
MGIYGYMERTTKEHTRQKLDIGIETMLMGYDTNVVVIKYKDEVHFFYDVPDHRLQLYLTLRDGSPDLLEQVVDYGSFCVNKNRKQLAKKNGVQLNLISTIKK